MSSQLDSVTPSLVAHLAPLSRRAFLTGAASAAALALAACSPAQPPPGEFKHLASDEHRLFVKLLPVFLPVEGTGLVAPMAVPTLANIDGFFGRFPPKLRGDLGLGLKLFDYGALVIGWHFRRFISLDADAARAYCARWESGNTVQRGVFGALKQIIYVSYWREPATWPPIGYEGPVTARYGLPRLGNAPLPPE